MADFAQRLREADRVVRRFRDTGRRVRANEARGVAQQHRTPHRHPFDREILDRLRERRGCRVDERGERRCEHPASGVDEFRAVVVAHRAGRQRPVALRAVARNEQRPQPVGRETPVPDPVHAPLARLDRAVRTGHQIGEEQVRVALLKREALAQQIQHLFGQHPLVDEPAPGDIARIRRPHVRHQLCTHRRAAAVRTDQQVGRLGVAAREMRDDALAVLLESLERVARTDDAGRQRALQRRVDHVPRGLRLRHREALHDAVVRIDVDPVDRIDGGLARQRYVAECERPLDRRLQHDAAAAAVQVVR
ncbi:hypothetical protein BCO19218_00936 [Burkholderia contaminans]|nr:hypothetical protein BCO19218_00936 [Burkholderia contaminans]